MIRTGSIFITSILFISLNSIPIKNPVASIVVADTVNIDILAIHDSLGILDYYEANVITPVCETDKCYIIKLNIYWDQIGRFLQYDTISGAGLTKLDHEPFTTSDYQKLADILGNSNSPLSAYTKEELVKNTRISEIDGFTGATIQEIKESVISGAVYSCYTLWHIANGDVLDSIQKVTKSMFSLGLVQQLVDKNDQEINYFLINNFTDEDFVNYLPQVLRSIDSGNGYYPKNAIEKFPFDALKDSLSQDYFANNFDLFDYFTQVALLKKIQEIPLSGKFKSSLQKSLDNRNSQKNELIQEVLAK